MKYSPKTVLLLAQSGAISKTVISLWEGEKSGTKPGVIPDAEYRAGNMRTFGRAAVIGLLVASHLSLLGATATFPSESTKVLWTVVILGVIGAVGFGWARETQEELFEFGWDFGGLVELLGAPPANFSQFNEPAPLQGLAKEKLNEQALKMEEADAIRDAEPENDKLKESARKVRDAMKEKLNIAVRFRLVDKGPGWTPFVTAARIKRLAPPV